MVIRSKQRLNFSNSKPFNIVLVNPEIPPNTGNIARLCAATNTKLHLIHPLGFKITDRELKRAGLDYWHLLDIEEHENWEKFCLGYKWNHAVEAFCQNVSANGQDHDTVEPNFWFISTRGEKNIWDIEFNPGDFLIFGSETKGLDEELLNKNKDKVVSIPMNGQARSINLSTSVGIVLYEGLRQLIVEKKCFQVIPL